MNRMRQPYGSLASAATLLVAVALAAVSLPAQAQVPTPCGTPGTIRHVIYLIKENRTFDNYFGKFGMGSEGATTGVDCAGATVQLGAADDKNFGCDIDHSWQGAHSAYDCTKMDCFDKLGTSGAHCVLGTGPLANHSMTQFSGTDIPNYWAYAKHFALGDHMFSSLMGPSYPNHLYTVAAQSGGAQTGQSGAINNPDKGTDTLDTEGWGCDVTGQNVQTLPYGPAVCPAPTNYGTHSSCWTTITSLPDEIESAGLDWRYYAPGAGASGYIWSILNAIDSIRNDPARWAKVVPFNQFYTDLTSNGLKAVSWIVLSGDCSEHPPSSVCQGENQTVLLANALMNSPYWCTSALFVTWDDFGGFYDHVVPPNNSTTQNADVFGPGFRVPLLVISPYARAGFVDKTHYEFSSLLKFAEITFGLAPLTKRDRNAHDMLNAFDFTVENPRLVLGMNPKCPTLTTCSTAELPEDDVDPAAAALRPIKP
jgi:phospholipase C